MAQPVIANLFRPPMALRQTPRGGHGNSSGSCQFGIGDANNIGICHNDSLADGAQYSASPGFGPQSGSQNRLFSTSSCQRRCFHGV